MKTEAIWRIAAEMRRQVAFTPARRRLDARAAIERTRRLAVNGVVFDVIWDIAGTVHDEDGREVMGVCEHDAEEPDQVMISLNRGILGDRPDLLRSTTGHELGHAVFDMPAAVQGERQLRLNLGRGAGGAPGVPHRLAGAGAPARQPERRWTDGLAGMAGERVHGRLPGAARSAASPSAAPGRTSGPARRSRPHRGKPGYPVIDARGLDGADLQPVADALSDEFGLSEAFIWRRLVKYRLLHGYEQRRR